MRAWWLVPALALTLTACGSDPAANRRGDVEAVTLAANDGDAAGLRNAVADLRATIRGQVASGDLDRAEGQRLNAIALRLLENAGLLEQAEPAPVPTVEEEPEPAPQLTQEEPAPTQEPEPTQEPQPEPTQEPQPEQTVGVVIPPVESPPAAQSQGALQTTSEPSPAA